MKNNEEREDIFDKIWTIFLLAFFTLGVLFSTFCLIKWIFSNFIIFTKLIFVFAIICSLLLFICRKPFSEYLFNFRKNKEQNKIKKEKEKANMEEKEIKQIIDSIRFANKISKINETQRAQLLDFQQQVRNYICKKYILGNCLFPDMTDEELYTLLFINYDVVTIRCYKPASHEFVELQIKALPNGFKLLDENSIKDLIRKDNPISIPYIPPKKKRTSNKVKRLRAERKAKNDENIIIKNGKKYQKPNYPFLAKEWTVQNMGYLNKLVMDESKKGNKQTVVIVPYDKLPEDRNIWNYIGTKLKDDDEIDSFVILPNGLKLIIESN